MLIFSTCVSLSGTDSVERPLNSYLACPDIENWVTGFRTADLSQLLVTSVYLYYKKTTLMEPWIYDLPLNEDQKIWIICLYFIALGGGSNGDAVQKITSICKKICRACPWWVQIQEIMKKRKWPRPSCQGLKIISQCLCNSLQSNAPPFRPY